MKGLGALLGAELSRFFSRRVMRGAFALGIALSTLVLVIITVRSNVRAVRTTVAYPCQTVPDNQTAPPDCAQGSSAVVHRDHRVNIHNNFSDTVKGTGVAMVFVAFVIGASFVGAEFGAGSLSTQLIFEPRRIRVVAVKAIAVGLGLALMALALLLYIGVLQWAGSSLRGVVHGLDGAWFAARAGDMLRVAGAVALAGIAAFAITVVARRTVAAVAILLVGGWVSAIIGSIASWRWVAKYNPATSLISIVVNESHQNLGRAELAAWPAAACSLLWAVGLTALGAVIFSRREVR